MHHRNSENIQHHLWMRESNLNPGRRHYVPCSRFHERNFFKSITPRQTVQNVDKPLGYFRKFTPDGNYMIVFSHDQRSLEIYEYMGIGSVSDLICEQDSECITAADDSELSVQIRQELFHSLFDEVNSIRIITTPPAVRRYLNREFSLFLDDGYLVLLASMTGGSIFPNYLDNINYTDLFDDTELYDYTFYLADLRRGRIVDSFEMEHDFIVLSHSHSVSLYEHTLAILSTYRQCVELFELNVATKKLQRLYTVGPFGNDLDRDRILAHDRSNNFTLDPSYNLPLSHLKQKILAFMYRDIMKQKPSRDRRRQLMDFYKRFPQVERMIVIKMQLIDSDHLLLRYEKREAQMPMEMYVGSIAETIKSNFKLFVFYNITQQKILKICTKDSLELLGMLRNFCDDFRHVHSMVMPWHASSPSNNDFFRAAFDQALKSFPGGMFEAAERFNPTLPISSQSFSTSPYLDYTLFNYDDRFISTLERPRLTSLAPINFTDRRTGRLKFRVFLEQIHHGSFESIRNSRDLVTFIFHPYEPFFISIQKFLSRYVMNFHFYSSTTIGPKS